MGETVVGRFFSGGFFFSGCNILRDSPSQSGLISGRGGGQDVVFQHIPGATFP